MTPPDTPSLVERLRDANAHIEAQAAQIAALQSTNDHLHEGLAANAKEMADMVGEVERLRELLEDAQVEARWVSRNLLDEAMAKRGWKCDGCGADYSIQELRARRPRAVSCCPERRLLPGYATAAIQPQPGDLT